MMSRSFGVVATCWALGASAFLLPPHMAHELAEKADDLPFVSVNAKNQILELPCSSCVFSSSKPEEKVAEQSDELRIQGGANNLVLNFTISEDGQVLNLNDVPIYPLQAGFDVLGAERAHDWVVIQLPASSSIEELEADETKGTPVHISGAGTKVQTKKLSVSGDEIIPLGFQILSLNDQPMTIDEVAITLLKTDEDDLLIFAVQPAHENMMEHLPMSFGPPPPPPHHPHPEGDRPEGHPPKKCDSLPAPLCRFLHAVDEKFEAAKSSRLGEFAGCGGRKGGHRMPGHIRPHFGAPDADGNRKLESGMPPHMRPHGHHGHKGPHGPHGTHHRHALVHAFFKGVVAVLIPVMAGICIGLTVSMVGLLVGKLIAWLWINFVRGGQRGYASVALDEESAEDADKLEQHEYAEAPPVYEDAPPYELSEKDEK